MRFVAFLRAINVGGHTVKMDALRQQFETLGLRNVETFIQTGNVLFDSRARPESLERKIEAHLENVLHYRVATFLRTAVEIADILQNHPFDLREIEAGARLYIGFMHAPVARDIEEAFHALRSADDELLVRGREVYWLCRGRYSDSPLGGPIIEKKLRTEVTMRNSTTIRKIAERMS